MPLTSKSWHAWEAGSTRSSVLEDAGFIIGGLVGKGCLYVGSGKRVAPSQPGDYSFAAYCGTIAHIDQKMK